MKRIEMIGRPLAHVRTPDLLNARLAAEGLELRVHRREVALAALGAYVAEARGDAGLAGLVVTTPLKDSIAGLLDRRTALVDLIGACNCVRVEQGAWVGGNFDGFGFGRALAEAGLGLAGRRVLLLGCGGAGKAIAERVLGEGAAALAIADPAPGKAAAFAARLGSPIVTTDGAERQGPFDIVVNASILGMGEGDPSPVAAAVIERCEAVVDIVISPRESRLARLAREHGKRLVEGAAMVRGQIDLFRAFILSQAGSEREALRITTATGARQGS